MSLNHFYEMKKTLFGFTHWGLMSSTRPNLLCPLFVFHFVRSTCAAMVTAAPETSDRLPVAHYSAANIVLYDSRHSDMTELSMHENHLNYARDGVAAAGNVLIHSGGRLLAVCDDGWNIQAANVVCKSLGYETASRHTTRSYFGLPPYGELYLITYLFMIKTNYETSVSLTR
jgi:hypothetical protein